MSLACAFERLEQVAAKAAAAARPNRKGILPLPSRPTHDPHQQLHQARQACRGHRGDAPSAACRLMRWRSDAGWASASTTKRSTCGATTEYASISSCSNWRTPVTMMSLGPGDHTTADEDPHISLHAMTGVRTSETTPPRSRCL